MLLYYAHTVYDYPVTENTHDLTFVLSSHLHLHVPESPSLCVSRSHFLLILSMLPLVSIITHCSNLIKDDIGR